MAIIQNISLISFQLKYLFPGFQRPLEKRKNGTSGSVRHPVVLHIQSEANILILGYSVIGQILTGDPHFHNTMFGSTSKGCEKLRLMVIRSTTRDYSQGPLESRVVLFARGQQIRHFCLFV